MLDSAIKQLVEAITQEVIHQLMPIIKAQGERANDLRDRYGEVMSRDQVAQLFNVSKRQVQNIENAGHIERVHVGSKSAMYSTQSVQKHLNNGRAQRQSI